MCWREDQPSPGEDVLLIYPSAGVLCWVDDFVTNPLAGLGLGEMMGVILLAGVGRARSSSVQRRRTLARAKLVTQGSPSAEERPAAAMMVISAFL